MDTYIKYACQLGCIMHVFVGGGGWWGNKLAVLHMQHYYMTWNTCHC